MAWTELRWLDYGGETTLTATIRFLVSPDNLQL